MEREIEIQRDRRGEDEKERKYTSLVWRFLHTSKESGGGDSGSFSKLTSAAEAWASSAAGLFTSRKTEEVKTKDRVEPQSQSAQQPALSMVILLVYL